MTSSRLRVADRELGRPPYINACKPLADPARLRASSVTSAAGRPGEADSTRQCRRNSASVRTKGPHVGKGADAARASDTRSPIMAGRNPSRPTLNPVVSRHGHGQRDPLSHAGFSTCTRRCTGDRAGRARKPRPPGMTKKPVGTSPRWRAVGSQAQGGARGSTRSTSDQKRRRRPARCREHSDTSNARSGPDMSRNRKRRVDRPHRGRRGTRTRLRFRRARLGWEAAGELDICRRLRRSARATQCLASQISMWPVPRNNYIRQTDRETPRPVMALHAP